MFYIITILVCAILIILGNMVFLPFSWELVGFLSLSVAIGVVAIIAEDGLSALIIRRLTPKSLFHPRRRFFEISKPEHNFYKSIKIKKWKDLVPELGLFTGFSKSEIQSTADSAYLERFLIESNYGMVIHAANALLGFVIMFIPICSAPSIWIPIFAVNFILSMMPVAVLRHTSYTLLRLYKRSRA
jgi:hypothetical protein